MKLLTEVLSHSVNAVVLIDEEAAEYLTEERKPKQHFDHVEDSLLRDKGEGFHDMLSTLTMAHEYLSGGRRKPDFSLSMKMDGSPSLIWGHDPNNGKFFVGAKSYFNKTPKVNFTPEDIDANHGHQPHLAERMKMLLKVLKKVTPRKGIFQGDVLYVGHDVSE